MLTGIISKCNYLLQQRYNYLTQELVKFIKYFAVGIINTALHWCIALVLIYFFRCTQTMSNIVAFFVVATVSFFINAKFTFKTQVNLSKYCLFIVFMALLTFMVGTIGDGFAIHPVITMLVLSTTSLIFGFLFSRFVVFK